MLHGLRRSMEMQLQFNFAPDALNVRRKNQTRMRVWLLASDCHESPPKARRIFVDPMNGASAINTSDLVMLKGRGDIFHFYESQSHIDSQRSKSVIDALTGANQVDPPILHKASESRDSLMLSFAPGKRRASGVFKYERDFECRTRFERLLHRLVADGRVPHDEFAFLIEQALPYLSEHSHRCTVALFLECFGNYQARSAFEQNDCDLLKKASLTRNSAEQFFTTTTLLDQARRNRLLAGSYHSESAQLKFAGFLPLEPKYCSSGLMISRVSGFSFEVAPHYDEGLGIYPDKQSVFCHVGSALLPWRNLLRFFEPSDQVSQRIVAKVTRGERSLSVALSLRDEFSVFAGVHERGDGNRRSFLTDVWSEGLVFQPLQTTTDGYQEHMYEAPLAPEIRQVNVCVSASLDSGAKRVARYNIGTSVGSTDVLF